VLNNVVTKLLMLY